MGYQVLARKYRPQRFSDVAGQDHVTRTLLNALSQGRIAHGYIFSGHRGIGKTTIARILAMALNCRTEVGSPERPTIEPCLQCFSCREISSGSSPESGEQATHSFDFIEIDAASNRGIDDVRSIRNQASVQPARDKYKIFLLDEAHQITDAAFNAILKTLEEPPDWTIFMMATTEPENIPQTIRSRCQHYSFHAIKFDDILGQLRDISTQEKILAEDAALALLAEAGDGSMRDALSIMDQAIASAPLMDGKPNLTAEQIRELMGTVPNGVFERLMEAISENKSSTVIEEINQLLNAGHSPSALARQMVRYLRNALMSKLGGENTELLQISSDERARAARTAILFTEEDLTRFLQMMLRTFDELNYRQEQRFHLELGLLKLVHAQRLLPLEQFLSQFPVGAAITNSGGTPPAGGSNRGGSLPPRPASSSTPSAPPSTAARPAMPPMPAPPHSSAPAQPAFSPFEADRQRKEKMENSTPSIEAKTPEPAAALPVTPKPFPGPVEPLSSLPPLPPMPRPLTPIEMASPQVAPPPFRPSSTLSTGTLTVESTEGSLAVAVEVETAIAVAEPEPDTEQVAESEDETVASPEAEAASSSSASDSSLDGLRDAVCTAMEEAGHNTAAALLGAGRWTLDGSNIKAEVAAKKTMLGLTMNAEAEKIAREALRKAGSSYKLVVLPGEGLAAPAASSASKPRIPQGSIQTKALEHPLVKQAQELFRAEVRSVLDLRDNR